MLIERQDQFANTVLEHKIDSLLDGINAGNGTPAAAIIKSILAIDARVAGKSYDNFPVSQEHELVRLVFEILEMVQIEHARYQLPFGTMLETEALGSVIIGGEFWTFDADRPGLHFLSMTSKAAQGSNLALLHKFIIRKTRNLACRRIGLLRPVQICDIDDSNLLHFPPFGEAGNVVLQIWGNGTGAPRFCAAMPEQIEAFATSIVSDMRLFYRHRSEIARQAGEARAIATQRIYGSDAEIDQIAVELSTQSRYEELDFHVHYLATDVAMRRGPVLDFISAFDRSEGRIGRAPWGVSGRGDERAQINKQGADGRISKLAKSIVSSGRFDTVTILAELANAYESRFELATRPSPTYISLYWLNGTIEAEVIMPGMMEWCRDKVEFFKLSLPEIVKSTIVGQPLSKIVDMPFGGDMIVEGVCDLHGGGTRFDVEGGTDLIDLRSGRIFPESATWP